MALNLVTTAQLRKELRIEHEYEDDLLEDYCERATAAVVDYLEADTLVSESPIAWDITTVPLHVVAAILAVAVNMYRHRGDEGDEDGPITKRVKNLLERERTPVVS